MRTGSHATSLVLQLCLLRERAGLRPRVPSTLLRETVRLRPWTKVSFPELRVLRLPRERAGLWPRVRTMLLRERDSCRQFCRHLYVPPTCVWALTLVLLGHFSLTSRHQYV